MPAPPLAVTGGGPSISVLVLCHQRQQELEAAIASTSGQGALEVRVLDMASEPPLSPRPGVTLLRSDVNRGISWGRNEAARDAQGDVLVFLDDDAVLRPGALAAVRAAFRSDPAVGGIAFRIERPGGSLEAIEQPFRKGRRVPERRRPCAYFIGAAFAVRRDAYVAVGGSEERLIYGSDDIELAFRLQQAGYELLYEPAAIAEHRPSPRGRLATGHVPGRHLSHRIMLARTYLPAPVAALHIAAWALQSLREAAPIGGVGPWWRGLGAGLRAPVRRRPLSGRRMLRMHRLGGRILF